MSYPNSSQNHNNVPAQRRHQPHTQLSMAASRSIRHMIAVVARRWLLFAVILRSAATKDLSSLAAISSPQHLRMVCKTNRTVACSNHYCTGVAVFRGGLKNGNSLTVALTL
jgi:hypothetical protein